MPDVLRVTLYVLGPASPDLRLEELGMNAEKFWESYGIRLQARVVPVDPIGDLAASLVTTREAANPCSSQSEWRQLESSRKEGDGVAVYVGGSIHIVGTNRFADGGTCGAFAECDDTIGKQDAVLLDRKEVARYPMLLAHELGHLFGLEHVETATPCGDALSVVSGSSTGKLNLMIQQSRILSGPEGTEITEKQRARVVEVLCASQRTLQAKAVDCPPA